MSRHHMPEQPPNPGQHPMAAYPPPPQPAPRRKHRKWPWIVGGGAAAVIVIASVAANSGGGSAPSAPAAAAATSAVSVPAAPAAPVAPVSDTDTITYKVTGTAGSADVTYTSDANMDQQQQSGVSVPFTKTVAVKHSMFEPISLLAQSGSGGADTITCEIDVNGVKAVANTSSGAYVIADCSAKPNGGN